MIEFLQRFWQKIKNSFKSRKFLCDDCKYNWREACTKEERPNAIKCEDYKKR
ncbi:MAG: hypothetical protein KJ887_02110 [Candidatus Omnitrophica bacterium]|nr:hypothetical protein [Candidatus Omnitrophota bacterium]MBU1047856.1 hypothetical protein [Candidatus Omnitrophota bacterium]MBU1630199.1 hypothetical protein [Candidatus Omnitrophota bacterium]MBU1888479.1 hypothetical protein [Candidatus Omnitrophota bacterium]